MPSNHLILCCTLLLPSIILSIRVFSKESAPSIRWLKYWSFSFSISPSNEYSGLISFRIGLISLIKPDCFNLLVVQGTLKSLLHIGVSGVLKSPTIIVLLLISSFILVSICLTYCGAPVLGAYIFVIVTTICHMLHVGKYCWVKLSNIIFSNWEKPGNLH